MPDLTHGVPSALSPLVRRVVAPNPSLMTGPGTNTYLVGIDEVAVIDPGPDHASHIDAIVGAAMADRVKFIVLTHTHPDHWPAAVALQARTGAPVLACAPFPKADEVTLTLGRSLADGDVIEGTEWGLQVLHTPGHAPNHLCFLLEEDRSLFTGDHVLNGTFTVVSPRRGGDMAAYLASLDRLRRLKRVARICPGHGDVIDDPTAKLDEYRKHRRARERQIVRHLQQAPAKVSDIVAAIYTETPDGLTEMARQQVHAHLLKLRAEGKVTGTSIRGTWSVA